MVTSGILNNVIQWLVLPRITGDFRISPLVLTSARDTGRRIESDVLLQRSNQVKMTVSISYVTKKTAFPLSHTSFRIQH